MALSCFGGLKMNLLQSTALALVVLAPFGAASAAAPYAKLSYGETTNIEAAGFSLNDGDAYGVALGSSFGPVRAEAGVSHLEGSFAGGILAADAIDYHATAYLDFPISERAGVFAGAGGDYVQAEANTPGPSLEGSGTGYHWALGGAYRLNDNIILEAQFRQVSASVDLDFIGDTDVDASEVTVGLRFRL